MVTIAEPALPGQGDDVREARLETGLVGVGLEPAQPRRIDDAGAPGSRCSERTAVVCRPRLSSNRTAPVA